MLTQPFNGSIFEPKQSLTNRYSIEAMATRYGLSVEDFKLELNKRVEIKQEMINKRMLKGYTFEQAENETMRCLYIAGFDGATFKD